MVTVSLVVGCSEGDQRQQQASGKATGEGETAAREELGSPRYAVSIQVGGSEPGRGEHKRGGDYSHPGSLTSERPRTDVPFPAETAVLSARGADYSHPGSLTSERPRTDVPFPAETAVLLARSADYSHPGSLTSERPRTDVPFPAETAVLLARSADYSHPGSLTSERPRTDVPFPAETAVLSARSADYSHPGSLTSERPRTDGPFPAETAVLPARPSHPVPPHSSDLLHPTSPHPASLRANAPAFYPGLPTTQRKQTEGQGGTTLTQQTEESSGCGAAVEPVSTLVATPFDTLSMALLAQQLPSLPCFSGEQMDGDGENFSEWLEWLELVANTCRWDNQAKLVNVATRLRGSASRFYRSCTPQQRSNYHALTEALRKRFTPVQIQSVQSSRFHERKQGPHESVDDYAQELQQLFHRAYAGAQSQGGGAEAMGQSVLRY